jgi:ubiquinone/menaquinone biosynthesis C-methylase UbiE
VAQTPIVNAQARLSRLLSASRLGLAPDGIYSAPLPDFAPGQRAERELREGVAAEHYDDYFEAIARSHSIAVMDREVDRFLATMHHGALILDIGGCWGWHWRRLAATRPDIGVLIIDFVRSNLLHARQLLGELVGTQVALIHADATALPFAAADDTAPGFDGVWTVQALQHIPDYDRACREAHRVLRRGGRFINYSLHITPLNRLIYLGLGKPYHAVGIVKDRYHLTRANDGQRCILAGIFGSDVTERYTECLFHPDLKLDFSGRPGSWVGRLDAHLGGRSWLCRQFARQRSFEAIKA